MDYAFSLATMIHWTDRSQIVFNGKPTSPDLQVFMHQSSVLPTIRNRLLKNALEWNANYVLWIDGDMSFPADGLLRLLSLNLPVVGANYPRRGAGGRSTAKGLDGKELHTTKDLATASKVEEVHGLGLGFCLVDGRVLRKLQGERSGGKPIPFFDLEMIGDGTDFLGEDFFFFERIRKAGYSIHVDHLTSWEVGHVSEQTLRNGVQ